MEYVQAKQVDLKTSTEFNEKWLQEILANDPEILKLGALSLLDMERRQSSGGRLDLLFEDNTSSERYCVEIQLGVVDESHIIRTLEYWDIERNRNPQIEHFAVIVAEDITTRFLNVIALFNKSVPIIAIQLNAFEIDGKITLSATKVLDISDNLGWEEDTAADTTVDRDYWVTKSSKQSVELCDRLFGLIREVTQDDSIEAKYNKNRISPARNGMTDNFVIFKPRQKHIYFELKIEPEDDLVQELDNILENGSYRHRYSKYIGHIVERHFQSERPVLEKMIATAAGVKTVIPNNSVNATDVSLIT